MILGIDLPIMCLLFSAGLIGAAVNAVAGGGTFFTFPAFLGANVGAVIANSSNAVAIWPGRLLSTASYGTELRRQRDRAIWTTAVCVIGAFGGAWLLLKSGDKSFLRAVPWLVLAATLLFLFERLIARQFGIRADVGPAPQRRFLLLSIPLMLCAAYGSYFGGGLGVMLMPLLSLIGVDDMQELNGLKNLLVTVIAGVGVCSYILAGIVAWPETLAMMSGAMIGGYYGGVLARHISAGFLRKLVISFGFAIAAYYFYKVYSAELILLATNLRSSG